MLDGPFNASPKKEQQLLLEICRPGGPSRERVQSIIDTGIDWGRLRVRAREEGVTAFPSVVLRALRIDSIPPEVLAAVDRDYLRQSVIALRQTAELMQVIDCFAASGIQAIAFKGPALAQRFYDDVTARPFGDLDVLIRRRDLLQAVRVLGALGYTANEPLTETQIQKHLARRCALTFSSRSSDSRVDLHWRLTPDYVGVQFDLDCLFERAELQSIDGNSIKRLTDRDFLLYLAVHGACHAWSKMLTVLDFARVAAKLENTEWEPLLTEAGRTNARRMLITAVGIVQAIGYIQAPPPIEQEFQRDQTAQQIATQMVRRLVRGEANLDFWEITRFLFLMQQSSARRARYLAIGILVPSIGDWQTVSLPRGFHFFYWPIRACRLGYRLLFSWTASRTASKRVPSGANHQTRHTGTLDPERPVRPLFAPTELRIDSPGFVEVAKAVLTRGVALRFRALGSSMYPFIRDGDIVTVRPVNREPRRGEVFLYVPEEGTATLHRLLGPSHQRGNGIWLIRGDSDRGACEEVRGDQILGKLVSIERAGVTTNTDTARFRWTGRLWGSATPTLRAIIRLVHE